MDDAFRHQLENKEMKHREDMAQLEEERQMELERADQRVRIQINQLNATVKCIIQISQSKGKNSNQPIKCYSEMHHANQPIKG